MGKIFQWLLWYLINVIPIQANAHQPLTHETVGLTSVLYQSRSVRPYLGIFRRDSSWWSRRWGGSVWWGRWHTSSQWTSLEWLCLPGLCMLGTIDTQCGTGEDRREWKHSKCYSGFTANTIRQSVLIPECSAEVNNSEPSSQLISTMMLYKRTPFITIRCFSSFPLHSVNFNQRSVGDRSLWCEKNFNTLRDISVQPERTHILWQLPENRTLKC